ncbi:Hsp20/alpha crystallin family protein [Bacillus sp. MUM 13]|uniref:Hsp20/alpha crystallin family protein n=1 Tax=Bacillus sp. MUM 13 TaxID=1678001 RepID=UPI0009F6D324|nr:Hsp20/alpha crystallin family protein [Bacillus sp. MUM 13]
MSSSEKKEPKEPLHREMVTGFVNSMDRLFTERPIKGLLQSMDEFFASDRSFPVEVAETDTEYKISATLPGVRRQDIDIEILSQAVVISVKNQQSLTEHNETQGLFRKRQSFNRMSKTVNLPLPLDETKISANHRDGILIINVPKIKGNRISIND